MKVLVGIVAACALVICAVMQVIADGATGRAATTVSVPHAVAMTIGDGPARALALFPQTMAADVLNDNARVEQLDKAGDYRAADALQRSLVARLEHEGGDRTALADALWKLGQLDAETGYVEKSQRKEQWQQALQDYQQALQLEPLNETYLLAAGNQALLNGDRAEALQFFNRALAADPGSADAREGLHRAQTGEGEPPPYVAPAEWKARH